jgi:hypothetical protein
LEPNGAFDTNDADEFSDILGLDKERMEQLYENYEQIYDSKIEETPENAEEDTEIGEKVEVKIKVQRTFRYMAVGICSVSGDIRLYYKSNYMFFQCTYTSYGNVESSIAMFDRSDYHSGKLPREEDGFIYRNPSDLIYQPISST